MDPLGLKARTAWGQWYDFVNNSWDNVTQWADDVNLGTRVMGTIQAVGGVSEAALGVVAGAATSWTGVGAVVGGVTVVHGADQAWAGVKAVFTGEAQQTGTVQVLQAMGMSETAAEWTNAGIGIALTLGSGAVIKGAQAAAISNTADSETIKVYRGVRATHPAYKDATKGIAKPRNPITGHTDSLKHNLGNTRSKFTSWSTDRQIAERFSGSNGVILEKNVPLKDIIESPDLYSESEILLRGIIKGAEVTLP